MITISFQTEDLYGLCVNLENAEKHLGSIAASALVNFISDANAFENVMELIDFLGADAIISSSDSLFVKIGSEYQATLVVVGKRFKQDATGHTKWDSVTRLKLVDLSKCP